MSFKIISKINFLVLVFIFTLNFVYEVEAKTEAETENTENLSREQEVKINITVRDNSYEQELSKNDTLFLSFEDALLKSLDQNLSIKIQEYSVNISKDNLLSSTADFLPSISLKNQYGRNEGSTVFGSNIIDTSSDFAKAYGEANFSFFQGGKVFFGYIASKNELNASKELLNSEKQKILAETAVSYLELLRLQKELESEMSRLKEAERNLQERNISLEAGLDIKLSVLLANQEVKEAEARIANLKGQFYSASANLNRLLNLPVNILIMPMGDLESKDIILGILAEKSEYKLSKLVNTAVLNNPDIKSNKYFIDSLEARRKQSISGFLPVVSLYATHGNVGRNYADMLNSSQVALTVSYDILNNLGLSAVANYKKAKDTKEQELLKLSQVIKQIESLISQDYLNVISGQRQVEASKSAFESAQESYRFAKERLKEGVGTQYELTIAQTGLERARASFFDSLINYKSAQIKLIKDLGLASVENLTHGVSI